MGSELMSDSQEAGFRRFGVSRGAAPPYERNPFWLNFFSGIAEEIVRSLHPATVFDAGCSWGFLVEALCDRGVEAYGRDVSEYAVSHVREDLRSRCAVGSLTAPLPGGPYDLVTCIEVLEHMSEDQGRIAIANLTAASGAVLFSSTPDDYIEPTHVNVQPTMYWLRAFAERGFYPDASLDASFISPQAFLVRMREQADPEEWLQLFAETLRLRAQRAAFLNRQLRLQELENENERLRKSIAHPDPAPQPSAALPDSLADSPAGQLILRYRAWLQRNYARSRWVRRYWEPFAAGMLRQLNPRPAGATPAAPELMAGRSRRAADASTAGAIAAPASPYAEWIRSSEPGEAELEIQRRMGACFSYRPMISVLTPVYRIAPSILREAFESVSRQTYDRWELCITIAQDDHPETLAYLEKAAAQDWRFRVMVLPSNQGISENSNRALSMASGEYLALLDHDDLLSPNALFEVVQLLNQTRADFIYSDKDQVTADGSLRLLPLFKPDWSPEILLNANYLTHLCVMRTERVREVGGWRKEMDGAQDWDLFLRVIGDSGKVRHIPKVLYHWRQAPTSVAAGGFEAKPYAAQAQVRCVDDYCKTLGLRGAKVTYQPGRDLRIHWPVVPEERVSVIYVTRSLESDIAAKAEKIAAQTDHPNFEVLAPNISDYGVRGVRGYAAPIDADLRLQIDIAAQAATGKTLVFLDASVSPAHPDWLTEITGPLRLPRVGMAGAMLVDLLTGNLRHCGLIFTPDGRMESIYAGLPANVFEQAGAAGWYRNWSAVSGACFAIRREVWDEVQGLRGESSPLRLDVALSLKVRFEAGWRIAYNPWARLLQTETAALEAPVSANDDDSGEEIRGYFPQGDPHFSPNLDCRDGALHYRTRGLGETRKIRKDYTAESEALVELCSQVPIRIGSPRRQSPGGRGIGSIMWFLPDFTNPFYGGVHTIFRFADGFQKRHGVKSYFSVLGRAPSARIKAQAAEAFPQLAETSEFFGLRGFQGIEDLPATDAAVCTLWVTAYAAERYRQAALKFYFLQDDETMFYPAGSVSALVEATFKLGYYGICNTAPVKDAYEARGGEGTFFTPCIDPTVFHSNLRQRSEAAPYTLFVYGRPGHPRNCFELVGAALRIVKQRMGDSVLALSAGADWNPADHRLEGVVHNLGLLSYQSSAALYRTCHAGVAMMMTRHPSYLPLELMASGALVIANRNPDTAWLLKDGENCLLCETTPYDLADRIEEGFRNVALRSRVTGQAREMAGRQYSSWDAEIDQVMQYMRGVA